MKTYTVLYDQDVSSACDHTQYGDIFCYKSQPLLGWPSVTNT